jgi:hypothetical protein
VKEEPTVPEVVTIAAIRKAARACEECSQARKALEEMDAARTIAMMKVFEALLGVKSEDEVKAMAPDELRRLADRRVNSGIVTLEGISVELLLKQVIVLSQTRRNVSWKDSFLEELGEAKAREVLSDCPETYSYKFILPPTQGLCRSPKQTIGTRVLQKR